MRRVIPLLTTVLCAAGCGSSSTTPPPESAVTPIYRIQGRGAQSPFAGQRVTVVGIVTGDFQDGDTDRSRNLGGFFIQQEPGDGDAGTSDGIFVSDDSSRVDVRVGDELTVTGTVEEHSGETRIAAVDIRITGRGSISATDVTLPAAATAANGDGIAIADLEHLEGMLIRFPQTLTVSDTFGLERYGTLVLTAGGRIRQFTNENRPDVAGYAAHRDAVAKASLLLDDGSDEQNLSPPRFLYSVVDYPSNPAVRLGSTVTGATGNLAYGRDSGERGFETYRLLPPEEPVFVSTGRRTPTPPPVGGDVKVMSFNVLNFFTTIDTGTANCGPQGDAGCRGADSAEEFDRQRRKLVTAILAADVDIVGLMEIENNPSASLAAIADGLNGAIGENNWKYVDTGTIGTDAIRVGFVFDSTRVAKSGAHAVLDSMTDRRFDDTKNRPALAQTFASLANGGRVTIAVNHLKSKGSSCADVGDPDVGDGQGNCNLTRTRAASALADWLSGDPTASGDGDVLIIGDLNAYLREDPLRALAGAGFENLVESFAGTSAYSFVFRGQAGALDHALASASLAPQVTGVAEWHINADEPPLLDYNLDFGRDPDYFDPDSPFRASDHDPVIIGLRLTPD